ncbi:TB2/DP1, HVA22 family-domain-containing protein [Russula aff. rugulosa BPL654]|nr:TB2/DP1, HVA22 family-domain-containing protein [Russula aff. rugulosa BPL654]
MLLYFTSRVVSCIAAFLYPGYASFKTLSQRPASEEDLERWLMYWSVLACVVGVEYLAEWLVSWIPFYYLFKTLFLLYLALPQTQGASYLYQTQLEPVLREHEPQIDAALAQLRARVFAFLQARARMLWDNVVASATGPQSAPAPESVSGSSVQTPALSASVSGPTQILGTLWRTYGPAIVAGGTALLQRQGVTPRDARVSSTGDERPQGYDVGDDPEPVPMPRMQSRTPSSESAGGLRARVASSTTIGPGGRFEEIEVPSDAEGGRANGSPTSRPSSGWFSWMSAAPTHARSD